MNRWGTRVGPAVLAVGLMLVGALTGCSSHQEVDKAAQDAGPKPLTVADATRAFHTFTAADRVARASGDERLALSLTTDGQSELTAAAYRKAAFTGAPVPRYRYGKPRLYVPTIKGYPRWFVAVVDRKQEGHTRTAVMAFMKANDDGRWQLSLSTLLDPHTTLPRLVRDDSGFAEALPTTQDGLVARPKTAGALQATMIEEGPDGPTGPVLASGTHTSGVHQRIATTTRKLDKRGLAYDAICTSTSFPMFVLRTARGGALALYSDNIEAVTLAKDGDAERVPVPKDAAHLLDTLVIKRELDVTETHQYAAVIPVPRGKDPKKPLDKIRVVAGTGAVTSAQSDDT